MLRRGGKEGGTEAPACAADKNDTPDYRTSQLDAATLGIYVSEVLLHGM